MQENAFLENISIQKEALLHALFAVEKIQKKVGSKFGGLGEKPYLCVELKKK